MTKDRGAPGGARAVASTVLHRVATEGAFAAPTLDAELAQARLDPRDARLATEIVYGSLRTLPLLDARIDQQLARGRPDPYVVATLRSATYQALFLSRVPDHAIVQESVSLVKHKRGEGMARLTNAVLRRIVEGRPRAGGEARGAAREPNGEAEGGAQQRLYVPGWVEQSLARGLGTQRGQAFLQAGGAVPPLGLRVRGERTADARELLRAQILEQAPEAQIVASTLAKDTLSAWGVGDPRKLPGFEQGRFVVQDEGANLVGRLLGVQPGERLLDACAGRGGKTLQLLESVGAGGHVTAVDLHARKLNQLKQEVARLGLPSASLRTETIDFSVGDGGLSGGFDRVLVDAPCTGLGTIRRRPEILLRLGERDPGRLADLQLGILRRARKLVRPGGILVFAVCSASFEEGRGVLERLEGRDPGIRRLTDSVQGVPLTPDDDGVFRIGPWLGDGATLPDVYQVVRWLVLDSTDGGV